MIEAGWLRRLSGHNVVIYRRLKAVLITQPNERSRQPILVRA